MIDWSLALHDDAGMFRATVSLSLLCASCGVHEQPEWAETVAAYEVPLHSEDDKRRFLKLLTEQAELSGFHVDAATPEQLRSQSSVSPITFNASVWRGRDDDESMASAMDFHDRLGRVWIAFPRGQSASRSTRFREQLVAAIRKEWPATASLPIMPSGAIPLTQDLVRTPSGYVVDPSAAMKYGIDPPPGPSRPT